MADYFQPESLDEALTILNRQLCRPLAGGTDFYPTDLNAKAWGETAVNHDCQTAILDISAISDLRHIYDHGNDIEIGANITWSDAINSDLPTWFDGVRLAGREVGGLQIQNRGTIAGNLCNASPAADGVPALMALNARIRLQNLHEQRELPIEQFISGNRQINRREDELVSAIIIPKPPGHTPVYSTFLKLGARRYLVISIAMVALTIICDEHGVITTAAIAVGACSAVAQRLPALEQRLQGQVLSQAADHVQADDFSGLKPLDDIRASADYRLHSARVLVKRGLQQLSAKTLERAA